MHILKEEQFVKLPQSKKFERTKAGENAMKIIHHCGNAGVLIDESCKVSMGDEIVGVKVLGWASLKNCPGDVLKAKVYKTDEIISFSLDDFIDVFPPLEYEDPELEFGSEGEFDE